MKLTILLLLILSSCQTASAQPLYVDDNAPNDPAPGNPLISDPEENGTIDHPFDAIQQAIDAAANGDEVIILPGTYTGDGNRDIDFKGKPITVRGSDPDDPNVVAATIIDCQGTEAQPHRGFYFHSGEDKSSVLSGICIKNGYGPMIVVSVIDSEPHSFGGGVFCHMVSPKLQKVIIADSISEVGGAIFAVNSDVHLISCILSGNRALLSGGAGYFYYGKVLLDNCNISLNRSQNVAGGIGSTGSDLMLKRCNIMKNEAGRVGGGLYVRGPLSLEKSVICDNMATKSGAGIYLDMCQQNVNIQNCLIKGNQSKLNGGGINAYHSEGAVKNCTIVGNRSDQRGGGVFCDDGTNITITNSILWDNLAAEGVQISFPLYNDDWEQRELHVRYSNVQGGPTGVKGSSTMLDWQEGNIDLDPLFANPGHWDGDSWISGDYHLKSWAGRWDSQQERWVTDDVHSPCIDAGDPSSNYSVEPVYNGDRINIGAYGNTEYASKTPNCPQPPIGDLDADCKVTFADFALFAEHWLDCNLDPPIACD